MKLYKREFLNPKDGIALLEVSASLSHDWLDAHAKFSDCNRVVTLEFHANDNKQLRERKKKLDKIIASLTSLRDFLDDVKL